MIVLDSEWDKYMKTQDKTAHKVENYIDLAIELGTTPPTAFLNTGNQYRFEIHQALKLGYQLALSDMLNLIDANRP